jgi:uncharacterized YccA/Bax inhibitor family protein
MATANPAFNEDIFRREGYAASYGTTMTVGGSALKTLVLTVILLSTALFAWSSAAPIKADNGAVQFAPATIGYIVGGSLVGVILAFITIFKPKAAPFTSPFYAAAEGLALGGLSVIVDAQYPGIAIQAVGITVATLVSLLTLYSAGIIRNSPKFTMGVVAATGGIALVYFVQWILHMFGVAVPFLQGNGMISIGFSLFVVVIAAMNLVLDFDFIEQGARQGAPKYMEWYGAFGLMVTLVWLYIEILRLLAKLRSRD